MSPKRTCCKGSSRRDDQVTSAVGEGNLAYQNWLPRRKLTLAGSRTEARDCAGS